MRCRSPRCSPTARSRSGSAQARRDVDFEVHVLRKELELGFGLELDRRARWRRPAAQAGAPGGSRAGRLPAPRHRPRGSPRRAVVPRAAHGRDRDRRARTRSSPRAGRFRRSRGAGQPQRRRGGPARRLRLPPRGRRRAGRVGRRDVGCQPHRLLNRRLGRPGSRYGCSSSWSTSGRYLRFFDSVIRELIERGHTVQLVFEREEGAPGPLEQALARPHGAAPELPVEPHPRLAPRPVVPRRPAGARRARLRLLPPARRGPRALPAATRPGGGRPRRSSSSCGSRA